MLEKRLCLRCEGKLQYGHDCRFKWLTVLLVDQDGSNGDAILIVSDKKQKRREVDLLEKSGTNFVKIRVFSTKKKKKAIGYDDQKVKQIDFGNSNHESIGSNEFIKPMVVQKGDLANSKGKQFDFDKKLVVYGEVQLLKIVNLPMLLTLAMKDNILKKEVWGWFV